MSVNYVMTHEDLPNNCVLRLSPPSHVFFQLNKNEYHHLNLNRAKLALIVADKLISLQDKQARLTGCSYVPTNVQQQLIHQ